MKWLFPGVTLLLAVALAAAACAPRVQPAGPAEGPGTIAPDGFVAPDGTLLPLRRWLPDGRPEAVILALHGFNDYSHAFDGAGHFWAARGIATYAYDQRGFGATSPRGVWPGRATLVGDARAALEALRVTHPDVPLVLLGESMGGAVAILAQIEGEAPVADAAVLVAPAVWGRRHISPWQRIVLDVSVRLAPWGTVSPRGLGIVASDNVEALRALGRDPLVLKETRIDAIYGLVALMDRALAAAPRMPGPVLVLYGANDQIVPPAPTFETVAALGADARMAFYDNGYHLLLRDLEAHKPLSDIAAWIRDPDGPLPSHSDHAARERLAHSIARRPEPAETQVVAPAPTL